MRSVPILTFHSIDDSGSMVATAEEHFGEQMDQLAGAGWHGCEVSRVLEWAQCGAELPAHTFGIAFDDGYRSVIEVAFPALQRCSFTATVFAIIGRCGADNRWPGQPESIPSRPLMDWDHLGVLSEAGWEIGAHGVTHSPLTQLSAGELADEVEGSRRTLAQRLGVDPRLFAYPYGASNARVRAAVERAFHGACGVRMGPVQRGSDPYDLPRIDSYYLRHRCYAATLGQATGRAYLTLRGLARSLDPRRR